jgi:hypothetical protein
MSASGCGCSTALTPGTGKGERRSRPSSTGAGTCCGSEEPGANTACRAEPEPRRTTLLAQRPVLTEELDMNAMAGVRGAFSARDSWPETGQCSAAAARVADYAGAVL